MELCKGIIAEELFLYLIDFKALIISDLHAGYEEALHKQGYIIPKSYMHDITLKIKQAITKLEKQNFKVNSLILNGDVIHSFSKHTLDEKYALKKILGLLSSIGPIIIIKGNHDVSLSYVINNNVTIVPNMILGNILITHGDSIDKKLNKKIDTIIIGHEHPSIELKSGARKEKYKCFLKGSHNDKDLLVMPSANPLVDGSDILKGKYLSPYIKDINKFRVYIIEDEIYDFGLIKDLLRKLH